MEPLTSLTGKYARFTWGEQQQDTFDLIKCQIINACYLTMPKWDRPFIIFTDASEVAVAAAITQTTDDNNSLEFIGFASKKLTETQRNWSPTERELYAIIWACEHFEQYIKGSRPLVYSDHASLEHLLNFESPKVRRWAIRLSEFNPFVTHIGGAQNNVADWLSRSVPEEDESAIPSYVYVPEVLHMVHDIESSFTLPKPEEMLIDAKAEEAELPPGTFDWYNGTAYGRVSRRMYIPKRYRNQLLLWFHTSRFGGHQGVTRTTNRLRKFVWWPNLQLSVLDFINSCPVCNAIKPLKSTKGERGALDRPNLFQLISIDYIGPRKYMGRSFYILVIVDHYSRYMVTVVVDSIATPTTANAIRDHWVAKFGAPRAILADRGSTFTAQSFTNYVRKELLSSLYFASTEYPQGNGINESSHRILETAIKTYPPNTNTVETIVAESTLLYNVTPNRRIGDTPASLTFGCDLHIPGLQDFEPEATEESRLTLLRSFRGLRILMHQLSQIEELSPIRKDRSAMIPFKVGDIVTYRLSQSERKKVIHFSEETKYTATRSFPQRVIKVMPKDIEMVPLWTRGKPRSAPKEQCKLITTFIPELMREEAQQLYPGMPWLERPQVDSSYDVKPPETTDSNPMEPSPLLDIEVIPSPRKRRRQ